MGNARSTVGEIPDEYTDIITQDEYELSMPHMKYRITKTMLILFCWMSYGMINEVYGPTLPGIKLITNINNEEMGAVLALRSVGTLSGLLIGGVSADIWKRQLELSLAISLFGSGVTVALIPICRSLFSISCMVLLHGAFSAGIVSASTPILFDLWHEKLTGPFNLVCAGSGVGSASVPLILKLFNTGPDYNAKIRLNAVNSTLNSTIIKDIASYLLYTYVTVGGFCCIIALLALLYLVIPNPIETDQDSTKYLRNEHSITSSVIKMSKTCKDKLKLLGKRWFRQFYHNICDLETCSIAWLAFLVSTFCMGTDIIINKYTFSFGVEGDLALHNSSAYTLQTFYWICFSSGRVIVTLLAIKISPKWLLAIESIGLAIIAIVQSSFQTILPIFYVCTILFAMFDSPIFPTIFGVLRLSGSISMNLMTIIYCGNSFGSIIFQYVTGALIHKYGYFTLPYSILFGSASNLVCVLILLIITQTFEKGTYEQMEDKIDLQSDLFEYRPNENLE